MGKIILLNPIAIGYIFIRICVRVLIGRKKRNKILLKVGWMGFDGFLKSFLPSQIIWSLIVNETIFTVKRKYARHEPHVTELLERTKGKLFIDVGANHGYYSFLLYDNYQKIIAIEPHPENIQVMELVKQKFGYNKVDILRLTVSDCDGTIRLFIAGYSASHSIVSARTRLAMFKNDNYVLVKSKTLSSIIGQQIVDLVKVDVEGAEWLVLKGAEPVMHQINSWLVELHNRSRKREMEELFQLYGYNTRWVDRSHIFCWRDKNSS